MRIQIFTVGKIRLKPAAVLAQDYLSRLRHYFPIEMKTLKSAAEIFERQKNPGEEWIFLEERGKNFSSAEFAKWLEEKQLRSVKTLNFFAGPAQGWTEAVKKKADLFLSLSSFTLQHELALVVLLEQIYRAGTILKGEPYHK